MTAKEPRSKRPRPRPAPEADRGARPRPGRSQPRYRPGEEDLRRMERGVLLVHEDDDVIVVDKPPGLLTADPERRTKVTLFDIVKEHVRAGARRRGGRAWIIHRLDRDASGLVVFAKSEKAFSWLKEDFRAKRVHRLYLALVEGEITGGPETPDSGDSAAGADAASPKEKKKELSGTIQSFLEEDEEGEVRSVRPGETVRRRAPRPTGGPMRQGSLSDGEARLAVTHYRVLGADRGFSLLQVRLQTGRRNQIRIHMKEFGHPLVGDLKYGSRSDPFRRLALHATELGFTHPGSGQTVRFFSPSPPFFYGAAGLAVPPRAAPRPQDAPPPISRAAAAASWDHVAEWYDTLVEEGRSDHFEQIILPGALRLLSPQPGMRVLDLACGQGALCRRLAASGASVVGIDTSERLIAAAKERSGDVPIRFEVADARELERWAEVTKAGPFDAVTCIMALMNIEPIDPVLRGAAALLKPGGVFVAVIIHPAFRSPGQTAWGWEQPAQGPSRQYRRVDGYLSTGHREITMNPGRVARGERPITTMTYHRPVQAYVKSCAESRLLIDALEEWPSSRRSQSGPRAAEENRARGEIPMFLGWRAMKIP